jgi:hypothetical protein
MACLVLLHKKYFQNFGALWNYGWMWSVPIFNNIFSTLAATAGCVLIIQLSDLFAIFD